MTSAHIVTIIGAGRIGRTLGSIILANNPSVECRFWDLREELRSKGLTSVQDAMSGTSVVIVAVTSSVLPLLADELNQLSAGTIVVSIAKGAPLLQTVSPAEFLLEHLHQQPVVIIGGPMMAEEMSAERPGEAVIASNNSTASQTIIELLRHAHVRTTVSDQPVAVSRAGVLKNVYACTIGMIDGGELPSDLHRRGHQLVREEFLDVGQALGIRATILQGPAGLGDFETTIHSPHSRNRRSGEELVRNGVRVESAEALHSFRAVLNALNGHHAAPLLRTAADIVDGKAKPEKLYQLITSV